MGEQVHDTEEEMEAAEETEKIKEILSKLQYLQAEYENYKKGIAKDIENIQRYSNEALVLKLLPIIDDFEASLRSVGDEKILKGFELIYNNLLETLRKEGLEELKALGEKFDPFKHEAVLEINDPAINENEIVGVVQKGYMFKSKVIRASKVKVVKHHLEEEKEGGTNG